MARVEAVICRKHQVLCSHHFSSVHVRDEDDNVHLVSRIDPICPKCEGFAVDVETAYFDDPTKDTNG